MTAAEHDRGSPIRKRSVLLALRYYGRQMARLRRFTVPGMLLTPPTVKDPVAPEPLRPKASDVRFERVTFAHAGGLPLFAGLDLAVPNGTRLGLVGRSGGGKTTLTRL